MDRTGPVIKFEHSMANVTIVKGEEISISQATAYDVLKGESAVKFSLICVDTGEYIYQNLPCTQNYSYVPTKCGNYQITYVAKDAGNRESKKDIYVVVKEDDAPQISIDASIKSEYALGDTLNYISANVTDESEYGYYMLVLRPNGKYVVVKQGERYVFDVTGGYQVVFYAEDIYYNITKIVYTVSVKG